MSVKMTHLEERAYLASLDAHRLEELAAELRSLDFEISACGHDGSIHYKKVCEKVPGVIKSLVNYLPN